MKLPSWLRWVCAGLVVIGLILLVVVYWEWLSGWESGSTTLRNVALMVAGVIALWFAYWRSRVADRQAETSHRSLLNERYQKGAEMLGSDVLSVRLGGIYALQSLAEEEPTRYHVQIMRLLCAFVRPPTADTTLDGALVREDVHAAMKTIATRSNVGIELEPEGQFYLDLTRAQLNGVQLYAPDPNPAHQKGAQLNSARLKNAQLNDAGLSLAHLEDTHLAGAHLNEAFLIGAHLNGADLNGAHLKGADLTTADLTGAHLKGAHLNEAFLIGAHLKRTDLTDAELTGAVLSGAVSLPWKVSPNHNLIRRVPIPITHPSCTKPMMLKLVTL